MPNPLCVNSYKMLERAVALAIASPEPLTFLDIGANEGGFLNIASSLQAQAFEPVPDVHQRLIKYQGQRPNTQLFQLAISDRCTHCPAMTVYNAWTLDLPGAVRMEAAPRYAAQTFPVTFTTLDSHLLRHPCTPAIIKLDVDGYEFHALRGMLNTIYTYRPVIYIELSYLPVIMGESVETFLDQLAALDYTVCSNDGVYRTKDRITLLEHFPWRTSFDVTMIPTERLGDYPL